MLKLIKTLDVKNQLGEGVFWHQPSQSLWWTDIHGNAIYRLDWASQQLDSWALPEGVTAFVVLETAPLRILGSFKSGFAYCWPDSGRLQWLAKPQAHIQGNRFNDGRLDRQGRFWSATMVEQEQGQPRGVLYRLDGAQCVAQLDNLQIPNALCWSADARRLYHTDMPSKAIRVYDFDPVKGEVGQGRHFATVPQGEPDGAIVDAEDHLICALWGGRALARFTPLGELQSLHPLPVTQPTCVALGGPNMDLLFVTTARDGLSAAQLAAEPFAGSLLIYQSPYRGLVDAEVQGHD
ncbi:SMP-30/gluconolactonase/LRE family protein [Gallaecimonas xiamenensis]|uniref:Regucalcin n=1 Tax=Gallaecimonas xiamenensis 3-C-1 TaxID=745411 RepID=K2JPC9_9GAMM|nr:SMP-30/gluconolactonase/LRE family protein [Gallaecimonas xiamenensis]EKE72324.1 regucalcin [Gallaecimonas xiamenensis 3-C-1]